MEEKFLKLTNAVYNLLEYFPEKDPLKIRAKEKALAIMDNLTLVFGDKTCPTDRQEKAKSQIIEDIDMLLNYFKLAELQGQLSKINCLIISNEYEKLKREMGIPAGESIELTQRLPGLDTSLITEKSAQSAPIPILEKETAEEKLDLSTRQKKILDFLQKNQKAQVMDLKAVLPDVTKRTIRRDLDELLKIGKIARLGEWNQVFYKMS